MAVMYLRPYRSDDLELLFCLDRVCFDPPFRFSRAMMRQAVESPGAVVLLACEGGAEGTEAVLGFCAVQMEGGSEETVRFGYVSTLDVAPLARGQGVAGALMAAAHKEVEREGGEFILLHVYVENAAAVRLYERLQYQRLRRERDFYGPGLDAWFYRKGLGTLAQSAQAELTGQ